jgi:hypothetical protein
MRPLNLPPYFSAQVRAAAGTGRLRFDAGNSQNQERRDGNELAESGLADGMCHS